MTREQGFYLGLQKLAKEYGMQIEHYGVAKNHNEAIGEAIGGYVTEELVNVKLRIIPEDYLQALAASTNNKEEEK